MVSLEDHTSGSNFLFTFSLELYSLLSQMYFGKLDSTRKILSPFLQTLHWEHKLHFLRNFPPSLEEGFLVAVMLVFGKGVQVLGDTDMIFFFHQLCRGLIDIAENAPLRSDSVILVNL